MGANESAYSSQNETIPIRRRAHTSYTRSPPDYFGSHHKISSSTKNLNLDNNNDEKHANSNVILTEFDVKQMMARSRAGTVCVSTMRRGSEEENIPEVKKQNSITSRKSIGSHDSGVGTHPNSPQASNLNLPSSSRDEAGAEEAPEEESRIIPEITVSLAEDTTKKQRNIKRAIMKKVFKKKSSKMVEMRTRSKSLGAAQQLYTSKSSGVKKYCTLSSDSSGSPESSRRALRALRAPRSNF
ncbi:unnamed protein product [Caenorhabditis brenneri]